MQLLLPKQHGAWAMLLIPFLLSMMIGDPNPYHIPLFIGWLFLYLATYPLLMVFKNKKKSLHLKWFLIYFVPALISLVIMLFYEMKLIYFGLSMFPFFLTNIYFSKKKNERALLNDISAIFVFGIGGLASYYVGMRSIDSIAISIFIFSLLFFIGSTFYVKTMIREKKSSKYKWISWGYHIGLIFVLIVSGFSALYMLAFIPSLFRAIYFHGRELSVMKLGILEIVNSAFFFAIMLLIFL